MISASVLQLVRLTSVGQSTDNGVPAATVKVDVQDFVGQSSVAVSVKLRFTPPPQTKAGRAGMDPIFELG